MVVEAGGVEPVLLPAGEDGSGGITPVDVHGRRAAACSAVTGAGVAHRFPPASANLRHARSTPGPRPVHGCAWAYSGP